MSISVLLGQFWPHVFHQLSCSKTVLAVKHQFRPDGDNTNSLQGEARVLTVIKGHIFIARCVCVCVCALKSVVTGV